MNTLTELQTATRVPSVLLKAAMAVTGLGMAVWLSLHMLANLLIFGGAQLLNGYSDKLRGSGLLWPMRIVVIAALLIHVACAMATSARAFAARPVRYQTPLRASASTFASRTMRAGGAVLLAYLIYHVATLYGVAHPTFIPGDVYNNLTTLLRQPAHAAAYVVATALISLHLAHGLASSLVSLGWTSRIRARLVRRIMQTWALLVTAGFAVPPLAIFLGWV